MAMVACSAPECNFTLATALCTTRSRACLVSVGIPARRSLAASCCGALESYSLNRN